MTAKGEPWVAKGGWADTQVCPYGTGDLRNHSPFEGHFRPEREGMSKRPSPWAKADSVGGMGFRKAPPTSSLPGLRSQLTDSPSRGEWLVGVLQGGNGSAIRRILKPFRVVFSIAFDPNGYPYALGRIAVSSVAG